MKQSENRRFSSGIRKVLTRSLLILLFFLLCILFIYRNSPEFTTTDLDDILAANCLTIITRNNANCYYLYQDEAMGFEYDLAKAFAKWLGVDIKIIIAKKWEGMIPALLKGEGHIIAASMTDTPERRQKVVFSKGYLTIQQHLVVHRTNRKIKAVDDLHQQNVHVRRGTSYQERLEALVRQNVDINIILHEDLPTEELIRRVAEKEIEITIADSNIASLNRRYYHQIKVAGPVGKKQRLAWATHPHSRKLRRAINTFFKSIKANGEFDRIYNRYYADIEEFDYVDMRAYHRRLKTRLPRYKEIIKKEARRNGFDWRLIAAQIYQESHLSPMAESRAGAYGLMQLMPATARSLGVDDIFDAEKNIQAGVLHLKNLYDTFDRATGTDRLFIALAAYNVGMGHIFDARHLAQKINMNPNKWDSLLKTLPLLRSRKYYQESKYGYCRGTEPIRYVRRIMTYYDILKRREIKYEGASLPGH